MPLPVVAKAFLGLLDARSGTKTEWQLHTTWMARLIFRTPDAYFVRLAAVRPAQPLKD
jgi:hypothetical protein